MHHLRPRSRNYIRPPPGADNDEMDPEVEVDGPGEQHPDLQFEQSYIDESYECLDRMRAHAIQLLERNLEVDTVDEEILRWHLQERVASLADSVAPLVFGRIDDETAHTFYIGRRHVRDAKGDVKVVDWRARAAAPFYRATIHDAMAIERRRRFAMNGRELLDIFDEYLNDPESVVAGSHGGVPDPLLAEISRARTGQMRDIVATIQAEQDEIIRSPLRELVVVQGGPGTGKTAVGLHRTAFLLYEHRAQLERERVLIVGPNRLFLAYISNVLPSLGETAVFQTTVGGLVSIAAQARIDDRPTVARLKGSLRMAELLRRACWGQIHPAEGPLRFNVGRISVDLAKDDVNDALMEGMRAGSYRGGRKRFLDLLGRRILVGHEPELYSLGIDAAVFIESALRKPELDRHLRKLWPNVGHEALLRQVLTNKKTLERAAEGLYSDDERKLLQQRSQRDLKEAGWSRSDIPLLDECDALVNGPPQRYGHAVVDEAQDLSSMELRMIARRTHPASMTILGDLAQATAPAAQSSWDDVLNALGRDQNVIFRELTIGYRVPAEIMDFANRLLPLAAPDMRPSRSIRASNERQRITSSSDGYLLQDVEAEVRSLSRLWPSVGIVCPESLIDGLRGALEQSEVDFGAWDSGVLDHPITLLPPLSAKGLEFDAVVVVEPALIMAEDQGPRRLYVALTRAVQHLSIVHEDQLPDVLQTAEVV